MDRRNASRPANRFDILLEQRSLGSRFSTYPLLFRGQHGLLTRTILLRKDIGCTLQTERFEQGGIVPAPRQPITGAQGVMYDISRGSLHVFLSFLFILHQLVHAVVIVYDR